MLIVVISDTKTFRKEHIASHTAHTQDVVTLDDTLSSLVDLEQYVYPSLFTLTAPVVHLQFMLEGKSADIPPGLVVKLAASPTVFLFEEFALPAPMVTILKKHGAVIHTQAPTKSTKKSADIFALASAIITPNKKDAWMNFQKAIAVQPVEALLGIMYWKVRDMMLKYPQTKEYYATLYRNILQAHARAWQTNTPLALMIEKVLLQ